MTTTIMRVKGGAVVPGLPVINVLPAEYDIVEMASLLEWFRADTGVAGSGAAFRWTGRKNGFQLQPANGDAPGVNASYQNSKAAVTFPVAGAGVGDLYDAGGHNLWPVGSDYSFAIVGSMAAGTYGCLIGNTNVAHALVQSVRDTGQIAVKHQVTKSNIVVTPLAYAGPALVLVVVSYDFAAKTLRLFVNGEIIITKSAVDQEVLPGQLRVGGAGPVGAGHNSFRLAGGAVAELLAFNVALHKAEHAESLAKIHGYLKTRYAIS